MPRSAQPDVRLDPRWTSGNLAALLALCVLAACLLAWSAARPSFALGEAPAVDSRRLEAAHERVNPNTASHAALRRLPGLGPVRVQAILDYRRASGRPAPFRSFKDLESVRGIGPITAEGLREHLEFSPAR